MSGWTPRGSRTAQAQALAVTLAQELGEEHRCHLADEPAQAIAQDYGIEVTFREPSPDPSCSVDGLFHPNPPRIVVARSIPTREAFSLLHEFAHYLGRNSLVVMEALHQLSPRRQRALEEDVCDAFAAEILLPTERVDAVLDGGEVSAEVLRALAAEGRASRAACCVRLAQKLDGDSYVVLADLDGSLRFCAAGGDAYRVARTAEQPRESALTRAARSGRAQETDRLTHRSGGKTPTMYVDACADSEYVYAIYQARKPSWAVVPIPDHQRKALRPEVICAHCGTEFTAFEEPCERCETPACTSCQRCGCQPTSTLRICQGCWLQKPLAEFPAEEPYCQECDA